MVESHVIKDLKLRLQSDLNRAHSLEFPKSIVQSFEYGMNIEFLTSQIGQYWAKDYNWTKQENDINQMGEHFHINMDGIDLFAKILVLSRSCLNAQGRKNFNL